MAQHLARLLGEGANVQIALQELNRMTRDDSDIRLMSDVLARTHSVLRALGLDPRDTTANEVYQALMAVAPEIDKRTLLKTITISCRSAGIPPNMAKLPWVRKFTAVSGIIRRRTTQPLVASFVMAASVGGLMTSWISDHNRFYWT